MAIRILLADDHTIVREGVQALLDAQVGIQVVAAVADGREAVAQGRILRPDVAVLDIEMGGMNGIEAVRRLAEAAPTTQALILSMHDSPERIYRALQAGARGYVLKEATGTELVDAVHAVHAGRRYLSQKINETVIVSYLANRQPSCLLDTLSTRERDILQLIVEGRNNADVAATLCLSVKTVETYRSRMMQKLGIGDLPTLVKFAIANGVTELR